MILEVFRVGMCSILKFIDYEKKVSQARRKVKGHLRQVKLIGHEGWRASQYDLARTSRPPGEMAASE